MKITPAHDANDYDVWQRTVNGDGADIGAINIMNADGTLNDTVPEAYRGLTMKKARTAVIEALEACGAHDPESDVEDRVIDLAHSDRSKTPIEPYLADQWFVKMDELAQSAMDAVTSGKVKDHSPERYAKSYLDWLSEKRDWPVGRQLWWGHRIPVWTIRYGHVKAEGSGQPIWSAMTKCEHQSPAWLDDMNIAGQVSISESPGVTLVCTTDTADADEAFDEVRKSAQEL